MSEQRKLAAVMFTDIVGYTALMSKDEMKALKILEKNRTLQKDLAQKHNGEFLKEMGDGTLLCFQSALDAVRCAMKIQKSLADDPDLNLRIGIHLGDIIFKEGDVFGDGVNVASRIEGLAEARGICFSAEVYHSIRNQPGLETVFLGDRTLKHVDRPVAVYAIQRPGIISPQTSPSDSTGKKTTRSIVVLPFVNMSADAEQEYFCDGITEEIINTLTHIENLKVIARTSSFMFKGKNEDIRDIGRKLAVKHVLEGSVRKAGKKIRITAQLIHVDDGSHLWSEKYDREMADFFDIQDDIALAIVENLRVKLLGEERKALLKRPTTNEYAYNIYLQGRFYWNKSTLNDLENAVNCFNKAIESDPNFALAYFGLADTYWMLHQVVPLPADEAMPKAKEAALKALDIDDTLAEAYAIVGTILYIYEWNWSEAEEYLKKAFSINPRSGPVKMYYSAYLQYTDRKLESIRIMEQTLETDPYSLLFNGNVAIRLYIAERYDDAIKKCEALLRMEPNWYWAYYFLGRSYICKGMYDKAEQKLVKANELFTGVPESLPLLGYVYAKQGKQAEAKKILSRLDKESQKNYVPAFYYAYIYNGLGEIDKTFEYFDKAVDERDPRILWWIRYIPFTNLRNDRRYADVIRKLGMDFLEKELLEGFPIEKTKPSIIVLPFENISPDPDQEYFSDGLTEEIITDLSHIHDLLVISRSSAMTFKGQKKKIKAIAREVNVQYVLEGSVRKAGNNLRITAQLIDAANDAHLWAEKYSGTLDDVFEIQEKVSQAIVNSLKLKLSHEEKEKITEHPIVDIRAYEYYFRARQEIYRATAESLKKALQLTENSMQIVGKNELLLASQGYAHWMFFNAGIEPDEKHLKKTEQCAEQIIKLDPDSVYGYRLLGLAQVHRGNIKECIQNLNRFIQKEPNDSDSLCWLCLALALIGKTEMALSLSKRLIEIDPQSSWNMMFASVTLYYDRQFLEAVRLMKPAYEREQENPAFLLFYFLYLVTANKYEEAFGLLHEPAKEIPDEFAVRLPYFLKYAIKNDKVKSLEIATDHFKNAARNDLQYSVFLADGYSLLNEKEEAIDWLENAVSRGFIHYRFLNEYDPFLKNVRGEDRFKKLMKRVKKEWENFEV